jgi:ABC-type glycerol-3-phosphate transport system substrate-binding protein
MSDPPPTDYDVNLNVDPNITAELSVLVPNGDGGAEKSYINALVPGFKQRFPNVTVKLVEQPVSDTKYPETISQLVASDKTPDLFYTNTVFYYFLVAKNCIISLEPYYKASKDSGAFNMAADFYEAFFDMSKYDGNRYIVPRAADTVVTTYNKTILAAAGIDPKTDPRMTNDWTWDDLMSVCTDVIKYLKTPAAAEAEHVYAIDPSFEWEAIFNGLMQSMGANMFDDNGNATMNSPEMYKYAEWIREMSSTLKLIRPLSSSASFGNGKTAFNFASSGPSSVAKNSALVEAGFDFLPFPLIGDNPKVGSGFAGWGISAKTEGDKRDLAWQFLNYMISEEGQLALINAGSSTPSIRVDLAMEKSWAKGFEAYNLDAYLVNDEYKVASQWFTKTDPKYTFEILLSTQEFIKSLVESQKSVETCINKAQADIEEAIGW